MQIAVDCFALVDVAAVRSRCSTVALHAVGVALHVGSWRFARRRGVLATSGASLWWSCSGRLAPSRLARPVTAGPPRGADPRCAKPKAPNETGAAYRNYTTRLG